MTEQDAMFQTEDDLKLKEEVPQVQTEKYLLFLSDGLLFGVPAEEVEEIITNHTVTWLPLVPDYVRGIINLRGQIIPIVDIRRLLNHPGQDDSNRRWWMWRRAASCPPRLKAAGNWCAACVPWRMDRPCWPLTVNV